MIVGGVAVQRIALALLLIVLPALHAVGPVPGGRKGRLVYHFHLHKCGGTSFCWDAARNRERVPPDYRNKNCNLPGDEPGRRFGAAGEYNEKYTCDTRLRDMRTYTYFQSETVLNQEMLKCSDRMLLGLQLRDPLKRIYSHIRFEQKEYLERQERLQKQRQADPKRAASALESGPDYLTTARADSYVSNINRDTRYGSAVVDNYAIRSLLGSKVFLLPLGNITRDHLEAAKRVLDQMVVFILERPEWQAEMRTCYYGWKDTESANMRNSRGKSTRFAEESIDEEWREQLKKLNALDSELYAYANKLALQQYLACHRHLKGDASPES